MSSNRLSYDDSSYNSEVEQSTGPMGYYMNAYRSRNCASCYPEVSQTYPSNNFLLTDFQVDIENTLSTRNQLNDKKQLSTPNKDNFIQQVIKYQDSFQLKDCPADVYTQNSLLTDPKINYRGLSTQHLVFTQLPISPTNVNPIYGNPGFVSSRDVAMEEYKKLINQN